MEIITKQGEGGGPGGVAPDNTDIRSGNLSPHLNLNIFQAIKISREFSSPIIPLVQIIFNVSKKIFLTFTSFWSLCFD